MEHNLVALDAFGAREQRVRKLVAEDGEEERERRRNACGPRRDLAELNGLRRQSPVLEAEGEHPRREREDDEPAVVYAHRNAEDARNLYLPPE